MTPAPLVQQVLKAYKVFKELPVQPEQRDLLVLKETQELQVRPAPLGPPEQMVQSGRMVRLARRVRWGPQAYKVLPVPPARPAGAIAPARHVQLSQQQAQQEVLDVEQQRAAPHLRVPVEGHADARGTNEYNLALGERRANAVKDYLVNLGVAADRITAVTKGEEAPICTDEDESCYMRNRRGHFVITAK